MGIGKGGPFKPINRDIVLGAAIGALFGVIGTLITQSVAASRSEHFQVEQQRRADIKAATQDIQSLLAAVDARDQAALHVAVEKVKASTLYLPDYQEMILPLLMEVLEERSAEAHLRIQSYDDVAKVSRVDESKLAAIRAKGWGRMIIEAMDLKIKMLRPPL